MTTQLLKATKILKDDDRLLIALIDDAEKVKIQ